MFISRGLNQIKTRKICSLRDISKINNFNSKHYSIQHNSDQSQSQNSFNATNSPSSEKIKNEYSSLYADKFVIAPNPLNPLEGIAEKPFDERVANILQEPIDPKDIEVKPDGILYLPEIKYRRILNDAFGPGCWALVPRGTPKKNQSIIFQEYALYAQGRFISQAFGEQSIVGIQGRSLATAYEGAKSNALMRCCKDIGVASELWDPEFISKFKAKYLVQKFVKNLKTNQTTKLWRRIDRPPFSYPFEEQ